MFYFEVNRKYLNPSMINSLRFLFVDNSNHVSNIRNLDYILII